MRAVAHLRSVTLVAFLQLATASAAIAGGEPPLLWAVSDDTLSVPFGIVSDVAVGDNGIVYLLDAQNLTIRRIGLDGIELPPLGRQGEGPGEFMHPIRVVARPSGGCVVLQDFYEPPVCLTSDRSICVPPDVSEIRKRFFLMSYFGARMDTKNRLLVAVLTTARPAGPIRSPEDMQNAWSIFRLDSASPAPTILFTDSPELGDESTVRLGNHGGSFAVRDWDVDPAGRVIYADPMGKYRVTIGHPADGESQTFDLPEDENDRRNLQRLAKSMGRSASDLPRVAAVYSIDDGFFLVKPTACISDLTESEGGELEMFDYSGKSLGRHTLECDYDPSYDGFFLRNGVLVVVKGGKAAVEASIRQQASMIGEHMESRSPGDQASQQSDVIRVLAYDLVAHYARR